MSSTSPTPATTRPNDYFDLPEEAKADDQYVVEKIIAKRRNRKGKWEYLLKWAGCKLYVFFLSNICEACYIFLRPFFSL